MVLMRFRTHSEGLKVARLLMVLSSLSPLFILWAIRGNSVIPNSWFVGFCILMVVVPNVFLWLRIRTARRQKDKHTLIVGTVDDSRDHILIYLFAILLPLYSVDLGNWHYLVASLVALVLIVFLFWHLNLHYVNLLFVALGYQVFTVSPPDDGNPLTGKSRRVLITRRMRLSSSDAIEAYRLSDTVYLEDRL